MELGGGTGGVQLLDTRCEERRHWTGLVWTGLAVFFLYFILKKFRVWLCGICKLISLSYTASPLSNTSLGTIDLRKAEKKIILSSLVGFDIWKKSHVT